MIPMGIRYGIEDFATILILVKFGRIENESFMAGRISRKISELGDDNMSKGKNADTIQFGERSVFSIEIAPTNNPKRFKLRFWVRNTAVGEFTKSGELRHSIREYQKFADNKRDYYLEVFDHLTPLRIYVYLTDMTLLLTDEEYGAKEFEKREKFYRFFGPQISDNTSVSLLYKEPDVIFLFPKPKSEEVNFLGVPFDVMDEVFREYIAYCEEKDFL